MKCCDQEQTDEPQALAPAAIELMQYLVRREHLKKPDKLLDEDAFIDNLIIEAKAARRRFRKIAEPVLRIKRLRAATGDLVQDYLDTVKHVKKKRDAVDLVNEAINLPGVQDIFRRSGVPPSLIATLSNTIKEATITVETEQDQLFITTSQGKHLIINDVEDLTMANDLLEQVSYSWSTRGQGLAVAVSRLDMLEESPLRISWKNSMAGAAVQVLSFFDREIRTLEDVRSLPATEGGEVVGIIGGILITIFIVGFILWLVSCCVAHHDLRAASILRSVGDILMTYGGSIAWGTYPAEVCRTGPSGMRECERVRI